MPDKEIRDYAPYSAPPEDEELLLVQPMPTGTVDQREYKKLTWAQAKAWLMSAVGFGDITGAVADNSALVTYIADPTNINDTATRRFVSDVEKATWNAKQNALTFDTSPAGGSGNPVTSDGIYNAINAAIEGTKSKADVAYATTANITLSGLQSIDGTVVTAGQRILVKDQTTQSQNGIYLAAVGAWTRALDANTGTELEGAIVSVDNGVQNDATTWRQTSAPITLGSTNIVWVDFASSVPDATPTTKGKAKLYTSLGTNVDGSADQNTINTALALKEALVNKDANNGYVGRDSGGGASVVDVTVTSATASTLAFISSAKKIITATGALFGTWLQTLTAKSVPVDADTIIVNDSASSFEAKKTTLLQMKQFFGVESVNPLGNIITETFANLSGWTARGGTIGTDYTVSGNVLTLTGNGTNLGRAIKSNFGVCMYDRYKMTYTLICNTTPSGTTTGCGVGMRNPSGATGSVHNLYIRLGMDTAVGSKGYIYYSYDFDNSLIFDQYKSEVKFSDVLLNDEFRAVTQIVANAVFTKMDRYTGGVYVESIEFFKYFPSNIPPKFPYLPSPWEFTINIHGTGTQKVKDYSVDVLDSKEADYMLISTSIGKGSSIGTGRMLDRAARQWADLTGKRIVVYAAANAKLDGLDVNKIKGQSYSLNPTVVILDLEINDLIQNGNATTITDFTTKVNALVTAGYVVGTTLFFLEVTPCNTFDVSTFNAHLYSTYSFNSIIKIYGAAKNPATTGILTSMSFDGLHPNKTLESIKAMALANHFGNTIINRPVFYDTAANFSLQLILDIPVTDYDFTGLTASYVAQSLNYSIPAGSVKAGDKLYLDVEFYTTGSATAKNIQFYIVPTTGTAAASTNIIATRSMTAIGTRQPCYREIYVRALSGIANCFVQNNASSSLHPYQDTSMSDLTIDWSIDNFFMIQMNAVTSTDHIFIKAISLNILRK